MSSTKLHSAVALLVIAFMLIFSMSGCKAMAGPEGTDLPWTERPSWEFSPNVPQSMMQQ